MPPWAVEIPIVYHTIGESLWGGHETTSNTRMSRLLHEIQPGATIGIPPEISGNCLNMLNMTEPD
jgi:hypothetical protein